MEAIPGAAICVGEQLRNWALACGTTNANKTIVNELIHRLLTARLLI
jgi:hypothetical protein